MWEWAAKASLSFATSDRRHLRLRVTLHIIFLHYIFIFSFENNHLPEVLWHLRVWDVGVITTIWRLKFLFIMSANCEKIKSASSLRYAFKEIFLMASHRTEAKKISAISFSPPAPLWYFHFLAHAWTAKQRSSISTNFGSSSVTNPIGDAILSWCLLISDIE